MPVLTSLANPENNPDEVSFGPSDDRTNGFMEKLRALLNELS